MANWTLERAFAHFGAKAKNHVWGWSAVSADQKTVVLTIWDDQLRPDGTFDMFGHEDLHRWTDALGNRDRIQNLKMARDNCQGLFRVVMVKAKDVKAIPRSIASMYPDETRVMRLVDLNERTGEFRAITVEPENA